MQNGELFARIAQGGTLYVVPNRYKSGKRLRHWEDLPANEIRLLGEVREEMGGQWKHGPLTLELWLCGEIRTLAMNVTEGERARIHEIARNMQMSLREEST